VTDGDSGLCAFRPDAACLSPAMRVRHEPGYVLITVAGEVDYASAAGLRDRLFALAGTGRHLLVDLDRVSFIDAAGLGVLAAAAGRAAARGGSLRVVCARPRIRRLFRCTGLDRTVPVADTLRAAAGATGASIAAVI